MFTLGKSSQIFFHSACIAPLVLSVCVCVCVCVYVCVCVWNTVCHLCRGSRIICHVKTASFLIYLPKVNGVTTSDIYFTLNMKYVFLIFFIDKVFAQYCTKGHCEKINDCLFWQAYLWLFSVLYGNAYFFLFTYGYPSYWNKLLFYAGVWVNGSNVFFFNHPWIWVLYALLFLLAFILISLNTWQANSWVTMGHRVSYCLRGDWADVAQLPACCGWEQALHNTTQPMITVPQPITGPLRNDFCLHRMGYGCMTQLHSLSHMQKGPNWNILTSQ